MDIKRILHVTGAYPTPDNPMSQVFVKLQVESLEKLGIQTDVCILKGKGFLKYLFGINQVREHLKSGDYDLINAYYMYAGWTARLSSALPLVVTYEGSDVYGHCNKKTGQPKRVSKTLHVFFSKLLAMVSSAIIVQSAGMKKLVGKKCRVIPHGIDLTAFNSKRYESNEARRPDHRFSVLFPALKTNPRKRFPLAEKGLNRLKEKYRDSEINMVALTNVPQEEVVKVMNRVDCLLLTSAYEGSPNVVKEALACNLPVVSVDVGDAAEMLSGVDNCYIVDSDPEQIALGLELRHDFQTKIFERKSQS